VNEMGRRTAEFEAKILGTAEGFRSSRALHVTPTYLSLTRTS
jgi:hypothetical protein